MKALFARQALLPEGWSENVRIEIDDGGTIVAVSLAGDDRDAERIEGPLIPGMPNLHSHAFQRALAGRNERGGSQSDSFLSWRAAMYRFVARLNPEDIEAIAMQLYIEMLQAGYTSVAEFHYLHHDSRGKPYDDVAETSHRIIAAATNSGIRLTLLPVFYAHAGFGGAEPLVAQCRFVSSLDRYARLVEHLSKEASCTLGFAPHSLRAVTPGELKSLLSLRAAIAGRAPVHMHVAEQSSEVEDCLAWSGARPVEWLLANAPIDRDWCLVHATHMNDLEVASLAGRGVVAGLCPSTEADLGDGLFPAEAWRQAGGLYGIGSDSHVVVDPFAELRCFEYGQRLRSQRRNPTGVAADLSVGATHYRATLAGGARALGRPLGRIAPGAEADFVVLDHEEPALVEQSAEDLLDAAVFGPCRRPVRGVMVAGRWRVRNGRHALAEASLARYRKTLQRLAA
ncbi:MAG: formimidoylglutamate deiminase [Gammaproteobacteria bacterium]